MYSEEIKKIIDSYYPTLQELMCELSERTTEGSILTIETIAGKITFLL